MLELHDVLTYVVNTMLWFYERIDLKTSNYIPSLMANLPEHVTFWPLEYLWITSHVLNLKESCLYFQIKGISSFLRI